MRRRVEESDAVPPAELTSYVAWCAARALEPYGDPGDLVSMRCAVDQWAAWELERERWSAAHGQTLELVDDAPWDESVI